MTEKLDSRQVATFEELLRACLYEQEALRRVLMRRGVVTNEEVLEEVKAASLAASVKYYMNGARPAESSRARFRARRPRWRLKALDTSRPCELCAETRN